MSNVQFEMYSNEHTAAWQVLLKVHLSSSLRAVGVQYIRQKICSKGIYVGLDRPLEADKKV